MGAGVDEEIERILAEADKDGDGQIDYHEFVELMSEWGGAVGDRGLGGGGGSCWVGGRAAVAALALALAVASSGGPGAAAASSAAHAR